MSHRQRRTRILVDRMQRRKKAARSPGFGKSAKRQIKKQENPSRKDMRTKRTASPRLGHIATMKSIWAKSIVSGEEVCGTRNIQLSVIIPYYRAGYIGWVALESLVRQIGVDFEWELLIMEESCDNPFGYSRVMSYWEQLKKVGCCRLKYFSLPKWIPLSGKWYYLINATDPGSEVICCNAADIYMSCKRLAAQMKALSGDSPYNWHKLSGNLVYDISSDQHVKLVGMNKERADTCCRAARADLFRQLSLVWKKKYIDSWMYHNLLPQIKFYYDTSDLWYDTVNITGLNNISVGRGVRVQNLTPPFRSCCQKLEKHLPLSVVERLRNCRKHIAAHNALLKVSHK